LFRYAAVFTEDAIKNNFVIIYELLDEILDHGFPQITSADVLKSYITQEGVKSKEKGAAGSSYGAAEKAKQVSMQVTGAVQWRHDGLKYKKNEVYLDIIESVSLLMSPKGTVLRASATGVIAMKCFLTAGLCKLNAVQSTRSLKAPGLKT
jgi:AP-2 complex subunit mu-1